MGSYVSKVKVSPVINNNSYSMIECKKIIDPIKYLTVKCDNIIKDLINYKFAHEGQTYILTYQYGYNLSNILKEYALMYNNKIYEIEYANKIKYNNTLKVLYIDAMSSEFKLRPDGIINYVQQKLFPDEQILPNNHISYETSPHNNLNKLLRSNNILLFVIIDNMEEIYKENSMHIDQNYQEMYALSNLGSSERIALLGCSTSSLLYRLASSRTYNLLGPNLEKLFLHTKHQNNNFNHLPELHKYINHIHIPGYPFMKIEHNIINLNHLDQPDTHIGSHIKSFCLDHPNTITIF